MIKLQHIKIKPLTRYAKRINKKYRTRFKVYIDFSRRLKNDDKATIWSKPKILKYFKRMSVSQKAQRVFFQLFNKAMEYKIYYSPRVFYSRIWHEGTKAALEEYNNRYKNIIEGEVTDQQKQHIMDGLLRDFDFIGLPIKVQTHFLTRIKQSKTQLEILTIKSELYGYLNKKSRAKTKITL